MLQDKQCYHFGMWIKWPSVWYRSRINSKEIQWNILEAPSLCCHRTVDKMPANARLFMGDKAETLRIYMQLRYHLLLTINKCQSVPFCTVGDASRERGQHFVSVLSELDRNLHETRNCHFHLRFLSLQYFFQQNLITSTIKSGEFSRQLHCTGFCLALVFVCFVWKYLR